MRPSRMTTVANDFSQNMFSTSTNHINTPLYVRVGGISQDNSMFDLYAVSIGASHVNMQLVSRAPFSACQPVTDAKMNQKKGTGHNVIEAVIGSFYGLVMIRDFIASAGELRVKQLHPPEGNCTTYMAVEDEEGTARHAREIILDVPAATKSVRVDRLTGGGGKFQRMLSWAALRWSVECRGLPEKMTNDTVVLPLNGSVQVVIGPTEGLLVTLDC
ncbi:MAG: hypothetical protein MMC23_002474 [Stictis urceolatum]|nr:hypothetical protein [Stictis urceolata]